MSLQGVQFDLAAGTLWQGVFQSPNFLVFHLIKDPTPPVRTLPAYPAAGQEVSAPGYAGILIGYHDATFGHDSTGFYFLLGPYTFNFTGSAGETVYGWSVTAKFGTTGITVPLWGGLLPSPFTIPPAGGTLNLTSVRVDQHDCGVSPPPPPPPPPYLRDTFTGPDGTPLPAHPMDAGPGWVTVPGNSDLKIQSNAAVAVGAGNNWDQVDAGATNYVLRLRYTHQSDSLPLVPFRMIDANNLWYVFNNGATWTIVERVAGVDTGRATGGTGLTGGTTYDLTLVVDGTACALVVNGVSQVTFASMGSSLGATHVGLFIAPSGGPPPTASYDSFAADAMHL